MGHILVCLAPPGVGAGHDEGGDDDDGDAELLSTTVVRVHRCCESMVSATGDEWGRGIVDRTSFLGLTGALSGT